MTREAYLFLSGSAVGTIFGAIIGAGTIFFGFWLADRRAAGVPAISAIRQQCRDTPIRAAIVLLTITFCIVWPLWRVWPAL